MPVAPCYLSFLYTEPQYRGKRGQLARRLRARRAETRDRYRRPR